MAYRREMLTEKDRELIVQSTLLLADMLALVIGSLYEIGNAEAPTSALPIIKGLRRNYKEKYDG